MTGASCCAPRPSPPPVSPCAPPASHCSRPCKRLPPADCSSLTWCATPPLRRKFARLVNTLAAATVEEGIDLCRRAVRPERLPEIITTIRQQPEGERLIVGLIREGRPWEAVDLKPGDGTAELVPGSCDQAVARVAKLGPDELAIRSLPTHLRSDHGTAGASAESTIHNGRRPTYPGSLLFSGNVCGVTT